MPDPTTKKGKLIPTGHRFDLWKSIAVLALLLAVAELPALRLGRRLVALQGQHRFAAPPEPTRPRWRVGLIGDSLTEGQPNAPAAYTELRNELPGGAAATLVINCGIGGSQTTDWMPGSPRLEAAMLEFRTRLVPGDAVLIMLGTNDAVVSQRRSREYRANLESICRAVTENGFRAVLNGPPWANADQRRPTEGPRIAALLAEYNVVVKELATAGTALPGDGDAYGFFRDHPERLADGIHPDPAGARVLGRFWAEALARAISMRDRGTGPSEPGDAEADLRGVPLHWTDPSFLAGLTAGFSSAFEPGRSAAVASIPYQTPYSSFHLDLMGAHP
jgi:lysophospholipase L1-like esterase